MSYSYVKTVFPDFKYSNVYNTKMYENLNSTQNTNINSTENTLSYTEINSAIKPTENVLSYAEINPAKHELSYDTIKPTPNYIETFQETKLTDNNNNNNINNKINEKIEHVTYTKHIIECANCRQILMKQFNIESDRIKNEEIMELISFIMFGLFVLTLIDYLGKK